MPEASQNKWTKLEQGLDNLTSFVLKGMWHPGCWISHKSPGQEDICLYVQWNFNQNSGVGPLVEF